MHWKMIFRGWRRKSRTVRPGYAAEQHDWLDEEFEIEFFTREGDQQWTCIVKPHSCLAQAIAANRGLRQELGKRPRELFLGDELLGPEVQVTRPID